jgi:phage gp46-like protein
MPDISTLWDTTRGDWRLSGADLVNGDDLVTPVLLSLFTDRTANPDDTITDGSSDPRGWWGDDGTYLLGSRLWLLDRAKRTQQTLQLAQGYIEEALQWMIDDGVVDSFDVYVEWTRRNLLGARVTAHRDGKPPQLIEVYQTPSSIPEISEWGWNADAQTGEWVPRSPTAVTSQANTCALDTETGGFLLLEDGSHLLLESCTEVAPPVEVTVLGKAEPVRHLVLPNSDGTDYSGTSVDDSGWTLAPGPFGSSNYSATPGVSTVVSQGNEVWLRKHWDFTNLRQLRVTASCDDQLWLFIDGVEVWHITGSSGVSTIYITPPHLGDTVIAIKARDDFTTGLPNGFYCMCHIEQLAT